MAEIPRPVVHHRLAELVVCLSGTDDESARLAIDSAASRHGEWGDTLLNVADALIAVRGDHPNTDSVPVGASS